MKTTVVNVRYSDYDIFVGRPSRWGNPFRIGRDGTRDDVIQKYEEWIVTKRYLLDQLSQLKGKRLGCYCAPERCHADILAALADALG